MSSFRRPFTTGLILAAGASTRLGQPKQLLPYRSGTLLGYVVETARACRFEQLLCVLGGAVRAVRSAVDFAGVEVVENHGFEEGCSSSIAAALSALDVRCERLVLLLGDQPGVSADTVAALLEGCGGAPVGACAYENGRGHPLVLHRSTFGELAALHGDRGVWKLLDRRAGELREVPIAGPIPRDIDTWEDYEAVLAEAAAA